MWYRLLQRVAIFLFRVLYRVEFHGAEHVPTRGPLVVCANHSSYFDAILIPMGIPRRIRYMTFHTYLQIPVLGWLMRAFGAFPVYQRGGMDKGSIALALKLLKQGEAVGIFPEGGLARDGRLQEGRPGAARIAASLGAPLVPVSIVGAFSVFPKGRRFPRLTGKISVTYHPPIPTVPSLRKDKLYLQKLTQELMEQIRSGLPQEAGPPLRAEGVA